MTEWQLITDILFEDLGKLKFMRRSRITIPVL